jgi:acetate---CoA ligase (ADP-forming)
MKNKNSLDNLFSPRSIAIVGATEKEGKVGNVITKNILNLGYAGDVYLVNPGYTTLFGRICFPELSTIPDPVELAIIIVPAKLVVNVIRESAEKIKNYVIISAGFSEIGEEGEERENELAKIASENDLNILGPNCLGYIIPSLKLNASFAGGMPQSGNIALVSQSGALAVALMDIARSDQIGFSKIISVGNKMQLNEAVILDYLASDEKTKVVGLYLEGIKNGPRFLEAAAKISQVKPVVLLKAGKTEKSQKAILSHTGALAGSDEIISAVCQKSGILRADNMENFLDLLKLFSCYSKLAGGKIITVTNAGGPGVLATDAFKDRKIFLADISDSTKRKLKAILPEESSLSNPIDMLGDADETRYRETFASVASEKPDAVLVILTPQDQTPVEKIASEIIAFKKKTKTVVITSFIGGERVEPATGKLSQAGVPNFPFPERAVKVLDQMHHWNTKIINSGIYAKPNIPVKIGNIIQKAKKEERVALYFDEAAAVMKAVNVPVIESEILSAESDIEKIKKYPVVLKVDSDKVVHKTDKKGLVLDIKNGQELLSAYQELRQNFPDARFIVQSMVERQVEIIVGMKRDDVFGPVIVVGLGGIYTEIFKTVDFFIPPGSIDHIDQWLKSSRIGFLFSGARGLTYDSRKISEIIKNLADLSLASDSVVSLDINPLLIYNDGRSPLSVDVKIII